MNRMAINSRLHSAFRAGFCHLFISVCVASITAALVFFLWYPWPLFEILGVSHLFWLIVVVDTITGPLLTCVVWDISKERKELITDICIILVIQICALGYGIYTVTIARPVHLVFEVDRFRVVTASEIDKKDLISAAEVYRQLPWTGPTLVSVREPRNSDEFIKSVELSMSGQEPSLRPNWWQDYSQAIPKVIKKARPIEKLITARPASKNEIATAVKRTGLPGSRLVWLPLTSAKSFDWVVFLDNETGIPLSYAPVDGFF